MQIQQIKLKRSTSSSTYTDTRADQFSLFEVDPHGYFACMYSLEPNTVYFVKLREIKKYMLQYAAGYLAKVDYEQPSLRINVMHQIGKNKLFGNTFNNMFVQSITIAKVHKNIQLVAISSSIAVRVFAIDWKKDSQTISNANMTSYWEVCQSLNTPIVNISFMYNVMYLSYYDKYMSILEGVNSEDRKWRESDDIFKCQDQFVRLKVWDSQKSYYQKEISTKQYELLSKGQMMKLQALQAQKGQSRKFVQLWGSSLLSIQIFLFLNGFKRKIIQEVIDEEQPEHPRILYQSTHNCLHQDKLQISKQYERPRLFKSQAEEDLYLQKNEEKLNRYKLSKCQNYLIGNGDRGIINIRSRRVDWDTIVKCNYSPQINPFFHLIRQKILLKYFNSFSKQKFYAINNYLDTFQFVLKAWTFQTESSPQQQNFKDSAYSICVDFTMINLKKKIKKVQQSEIYIPHTKTKKQLEFNRVYQNQAKCVFLVQDLESPIVSMRWMDENSILALSEDGKLLSIRLIDNFVQKFIQNEFYQLLKKNKLV